MRRNSTRVMRTWIGACALVAAGAVVPSACQPDASPEPAQPNGAASAAVRTDWPKDTVLALNGDPIGAEEVDAIGSIIARAEEEHTLPHLRRIALTNVVLPRLAARQFAGAAKRTASLEAARAWRAALDRGAPPPPNAGPIEEVVQGGFGMMGLEVWNWALDCRVGEWSEPLETPGTWRVARVLERSAGLRPCDVVLRVDLRTFVWDTSESFKPDVEAFIDRSKLEYVDESWRDLVPTLWQRRLRGSS
jgi:hypothetical protein